MWTLRENVRPWCRHDAAVGVSRNSFPRAELGNGAVDCRHSMPEWSALATAEYRCPFPDDKACGWSGVERIRPGVELETPALRETAAVPATTNTSPCHTVIVRYVTCTLAFVVALRGRNLLPYSQMGSISPSSHRLLASKRKDFAGRIALARFLRVGGYS